MKSIIVLLATSVAVAMAGQPGLDPKEVVRRVRGAGREASGVERLASDDGEFLIDTSGTLVPAPGYQRYPAVASDGANFLVVWEDFRNYDIIGARVTPQGTVLDPQGIVISQAAYRQESPALAFDGANFLVVWGDRRSDSSDIYGARVTPGGTVLDPSGFVISQATRSQRFPAVAFDGANFLVVWQDDRSGPDDPGIYGARVTPGGTVLDPLGFYISQAGYGQYLPVLAFDGANFLVVWQDDRSGSYYPDIYGARVTPQGTVLDPSGLVISQAANDQRLPALAFDGANFLVVWEDWRSGYCDIYGARVTPGGTVLDPSGFAISPAAGWEYYPALGFDGANFLVVWAAERSYPDTSDIYGARVTPAAVVLDPTGIAISTAADYQGYPAVAFDGTDFHVAWEARRRGDYYNDIYGARVTSAGVVFDSGPVVRQEGNQCFPALACGTGSQLFVVYQGWTGTVGGKTYNTDRIWGKMNPAPGVEEGCQPTPYNSRLTATIVRGVLFLPRSSSDTRNSSLLDISGRKVAELVPGPNDVSGLSPGVYFVRHEPAVMGHQPSVVTKVVIQ
jgi:phosphoribosylformylglycinamidine (FGAM) synthase PurS component